MTVFKIKNPSHSRHPIHTVDGVRHIGARKTRSFDLSKPGEKLVKGSDVLEIIEDKPKAHKATQKPADEQKQPEDSDVHSEGGSAPAGQSGASGGGDEGSIDS